MNEDDNVGRSHEINDSAPTSLIRQGCRVRPTLGCRPIAFAVRSLLLSAIYPAIKKLLT